MLETTIQQLINRLELCEKNTRNNWLHRYRGKTERQVETIVCSLQNFAFIVYVIGRDGRMKSRRMHCETMKLNVNGGCDRSLANGWPDFLLARDWRQWLTNNNLHIFCRVELALL